MFYQDILRRLLEKIENAAGAGFVAQDGETVQLEGQLDDFSHRLHLAYQGILLQVLGDIHKNPDANLRLVLSIHQDYTVAVKPLVGGYFLVLTLKGRRNLQKAIRCLEQAAQELNQEL
jgi:hypothetical protein